MTLLVTFDPGTTTGWAVFRHRKLIACGYASKVKIWKEPVWKYVKRGSLVVVEFPIYYGSAKERNPEAIVRNSAMAGEILGYCRAKGAKCEKLSPPRKWKGTIPKPRRGETYIIEQRLFLALSTEECQLIKQTKSARATRLDHNMIDAVGIGRWRLRRHEVH